MPLLQQTGRQLFRRWLENALAHGRPGSAASGAGMATVSDEGLLGRAREQERISRLLDEARAGRSGTIVICGETGVGKTALLDAAAERAQGMCVLRVSGVEDVSERPYAGFEELCRPVLGGIGDTPADPSPSAVGDPRPRRCRARRSIRRVRRRDVAACRSGGGRPTSCLR